MANFDAYYKIRLKPFEGGYCSAADAAKQNDSGGETYLGIARNYNPKWEGWTIIDSYIAQHGVPKRNTYIPIDQLYQLAEDYSKRSYWDVLGGDQIQNQSVAEALVDFGFNSGIRTAAKKAQKIIGAGVDGAFGKNSIIALNAFDGQSFVNALTQARIAVINGSKLTQNVKNAVIKRAQSFKYTP